MEPEVGESDFSGRESQTKSACFMGDDPSHSLMRESGVLGWFGRFSSGTPRVQ